MSILSGVLVEFSIGMIQVAIYIYFLHLSSLITVFLHRRPAGAGGTRTGHQDAADSEQTILLRRETKS